MIRTVDEMRRAFPPSRRGVPKAHMTTAPNWALARAGQARFDMPDGTLADTQAELFQRLSWVHSAVSHVAEQAALMPFRVKRREGEDLIDVPNHPFEELLDRPNPLQSRFELLVTTVSFRKLTGNAYWWLNNPGGGAPTEIWSIPPQRIRPVPDGRLYIKGYLYDPGTGQEIPLEPHEICHFHSFHPRNEFIGLSPIEALASVAVGDMKMAEWNTNFFGANNAKMDTILAFADPIPDAEWARMQADIRRQHGGNQNKMLMMLRGTGQGSVSAIPVGLKQAEMQFLEGRKANKSEIYETLAPGLVSMLSENGNRANSETGRAVFDEFAVYPQLVAMAEKINNDILPAYGDNLRGEFDDPRQTDRDLELREIEVALQALPVEEVQRRYYNYEAPAAPMVTVEEVPPALMAPEEDEDEAKSEEAAVYRRWLKKRDGDGPIDLTFRADHHAPVELWDLAMGWGFNVMPPFARKAAIDESPGSMRRRRRAERDAAGAIERSLSAQMRAVRAALRGDVTMAAVMAALDAGTAQGLRDALRRTLLEVALLGVAEGDAALQTIGLGIDWTLANVAARQWADQYVGGLIQGIQANTRREVQAAVAEWTTNGEPLSALRRDLERHFSPARADLIASTEVTRAYAEGNRAAWAESGVVEQVEWRVAEDERVCPICGPLEGKRGPLSAGVEGAGFPPAHPRCRCWIVPVIGED